jgi:hypothetical protein
VKDERVYLLHAIDAILSYTVDGSEAFFADGKTQVPSYATSRSSAKRSRGYPTTRARLSLLFRGDRSPECATS